MDLLWTDNKHNVRLLHEVRRSAAIYITGDLRTTPKLNWLPTLLIAKQAAKFAASRLNADLFALCTFWSLHYFGG